MSVVNKLPVQYENSSVVVTAIDFHGNVWLNKTFFLQTVLANSVYTVDEAVAWPISTHSTGQEQRQEQRQEQGLGREKQSQGQREGETGQGKLEEKTSHSKTTDTYNLPSVLLYRLQVTSPLVSLSLFSLFSLLTYYLTACR